MLTAGIPEVRMRVAIQAPLHDAALVNVAAAGFLLVSLLLRGVRSRRCSGCCWPRPRRSASSSWRSASPPLFTAAWLLVTAASLEMTAVDVLGQDAYQPTIALIKAIGIGLAIVAVLRYGPRLDPFNPAFAWSAMFLGGLAHGLWPGLTPGESLRSLVGSVAPFAVRLQPAVPRLGAGDHPHRTCWAPLLVVALGAVAAAAGIAAAVRQQRRLAAERSGPPRLPRRRVRDRRLCLPDRAIPRAAVSRDLCLLGANLLLLLLTGARAPLTLALAVVGLSLVLVRSPAFPARYRLLLLLSGAAALPLVGALALGLLPADASAVRAFQVLTTNLGNLSGRQLLWPNFEQAAAQIAVAGLGGRCGKRDHSARRSGRPAAANLGRA